MTRFVSTLLMMLTVSAACATPAWAARGLSTSDYVQNFGQVQATADTNVLRAQNVFSRLLQVSSRSAGTRTRLVVINSKTRPWAIAVRDGGIILSKGALEICYADGPEKGDARVAFVLGHEISHLTSGDFWHQDVHLQFANAGGNNDVGRIREALARAAGVSSQGDVNDFLVRLRERELAADDKGFLLAAVAGYNVADLLEQGDDSFLHTWVRETASYSDTTHFSANERTAFLRQRLDRLQQRSVLFDAGIRLGMAGHAAEGIELLRLFEQDFPSKELFNSLGFLHLHNAIATMPEELATRWWFPSVASMDAPAGLRTRGFGTEQPDPKEELKAAHVYLSLAVEADEQFIPARINLAVTEYFLGNPHAARAHVETIRRIAPDNIDAQLLQAPLLIAQNPDVDMRQPAAALLRKLVSQPNASQATRYNLARLLDDLDATGEADNQWQQLVSSGGGLPARFDLVGCKRLGKPPSCTRRAMQKVKPVTDLPRPGRSLGDATVRRATSDWLRVNLDVNQRDLTVLRSPTGDLVVAVNDRIVFVSDRQTERDAPVMVAQAHGRASATRALASGDLHQYGKSFSVLADGPLVKEYWYYLPVDR